MRYYYEFKYKPNNNSNKYEIWRIFANPYKEIQNDKSKIDNLLSQEIQTKITRETAMLMTYTVSNVEGYEHVSTNSTSLKFDIKLLDLLNNPANIKFISKLIASKKCNNLF